MIISDHCVHSWAGLFRSLKVSEIGQNVKEKLVEKFRRPAILPEILKKLKENQDLVVLVMPAFQAVSFNKTWVEPRWRFIEAYNQYLYEIVEAQNHERLIWVDVMRKIAMSPDKVPLVPD